MKRKPTRFWKPAAAGFCIIYLVIMALTTFLVKEQFARDYDQRFRGAVTSILRQASDKEWEMEETDWSLDDRVDFYQFMANESIWHLDSDSMEIAAAVYGQDGQLLARTRDLAGNNNSSRSTGVTTREYVSFPLDDYLTWEEKEQLAAYKWEAIQDFDLTSPDKLRISILISPDTRDLWGIYVQQLTWTEEEDDINDPYVDPLTGSTHMQDSGVIIDYVTGEELGEDRTFYETDSKILWQWTSPDVDDTRRQAGVIADAGTLFPYMGIYENGSYDRWHRWSTSPYLQGFPQEREFVWETGMEEPPLHIDSDGLCRRVRYQVKIGMVDEPSAYMEVRMESRPWSDAIRYMRYVYLAGLLLTLACMAGVIHAFNQISDRQTRLEETRRDFTNAIAHELKTPLGIIRNFAENMLEHNREEKRDYYLTQMIRQTEEMDQLVLRMIEVSKLDSEALTLTREFVSVPELVRQQLARLEPMIQEKQLQVQFLVDKDFQVQGDREYLGKAMWNLLSNAVDHNLSGGQIRIYFTSDSCIIENTCMPLEEDQILHAFDMLYTGDKSRNGEVRHLGMGLYLAKKILTLHGIGLILENCKDGVRVVVK